MLQCVPRSDSSLKFSVDLRSHCTDLVQTAWFIYDDVGIKYVSLLTSRRTDVVYYFAFEVGCDLFYFELLRHRDTT